MPNKRVGHLLTAGSIRPLQVLSTVHRKRVVSTSMRDGVCVLCKCVHRGSVGRTGQEVTVYSRSTPTEGGVLITSYTISHAPLADGESLSHLSTDSITHSDIKSFHFTWRTEGEGRQRRGGRKMRVVVFSPVCELIGHAHMLGHHQ